MPDLTVQNNMTITVGRSTNINVSLAVSLLLHLILFCVVAVVQSKVPPTGIKEYIPVDLVQLPPPPREVRTPTSIKRQPATPVPQKTPDQVIKKAVAEPSPAPVSNTVATMPVAAAEAPSPGSMVQPRGGAAAGGGASVGSKSGTGVPQPSNSGKGSYYPFHRLTRLPAFKSRTEPVYPNSERMTGSEARVLAEIYLNERGVVDDVVIKKSGGKLFDRAVIDAARQSSFHPGFMGEKGVPTVIQIPYVFKLK